MPGNSQQILQLQGEIEVLQRQLTEARAALAASRDQTQFLVALGHQLRNPLAPIRNSVALMKRAGWEDPILRNAQQVIDRQVTLLTRLVDDMLSNDPSMPGGGEGASRIQESGLPPASETGPRPRRILIVEDLLDAAITMELLLELLGHTVELAADGRTGLAKASCFLPEIILCDIGLPGPMDGYQVARAIRATPALQGTYLIALTGFSTPEAQALAGEAGFDLHLTKPVDPATLEPLIAGIPVR